MQIQPTLQKCTLRRLSQVKNHDWRWKTPQQTLPALCQPNQRLTFGNGRRCCRTDHTTGHWKERKTPTQVGIRSVRMSKRIAREYVIARFSHRAVGLHILMTDRVPGGQTETGWKFVKAHAVWRMIERSSDTEESGSLRDARLVSSNGIFRTAWKSVCTTPKPVRFEGCVGQSAT